MPPFRVIAVVLAVLAAAAALLLPVKFLTWAETRAANAVAPSVGDPGGSTLPQLRVALMVHPTIFYTDPNGEFAGLEYDLISAFAKTQNAKLDIKTFVSPDAARLALFRGEVDVVAMGNTADGLSATELSTKARYQESA